MKAWADEQQKARAQTGRFTESTPLSQLSLYDLIPTLSPTIQGNTTEAPRHLKPLVDQLELAISERACGQKFYYFSVPPRHYKSETLKHAAVKHLLRWPQDGVAYCTHTGGFANKQSRGIRRIAASAGLRFSSDSNRQDEWELETGGGVVARGLGGELTGRGFRLILADDPVKSREQAESASERDKIWEWLNDDVITRLSPDGFLFLVHTRWHPNDPIGRAKKDPNWKGTNIRALSGEHEDQALLPLIWSVEHLRNIRDTNPYKFASLYQGEPRPRGDKIFHDPHFYSSLPKEGYAVGFGVDLAYTARTNADWSICLEMWRVGEGDEAKFYIVQVDRAQVEAPAFTIVLKRRSDRRPGAKMLWRGSGVEKGSASFIKAQGIPLLWAPPAGDKFVSSMAVAAAWNAGRVLLPDIEEFPEAQSWLPAFLDCIDNFTGVGDKQDDDVDAMGNAHKLLTSKKGTHDAEESGSAGTAKRPDRLV